MRECESVWVYLDIHRSHWDLLIHMIRSLDHIWKRTALHLDWNDKEDEISNHE